MEHERNYPNRDGKMILLLDNYDSFTYNLYQFLSELGADVRVVRNDAVTLEDIQDMAPEKIVIAPGPRTPGQARYVESMRRHDLVVPGIEATAPVVLQDRLQTFIARCHQALERRGPCLAVFLGQAPQELSKGVTQ